MIDTSVVRGHQHGACIADDNYQGRIDLQLATRNESAPRAFSLQLRAMMV
jgi:hypothetical protein